MYITYHSQYSTTDLQQLKQKEKNHTAGRNDKKIKNKTWSSRRDTRRTFPSEISSLNSMVSEQHKEVTYHIFNLYDLLEETDD